jgi:hypothetical protein
VGASARVTVLTGALQFEGFENPYSLLPVTVNLYTVFGVKPETEIIFEPLIA